jgi:hypothetical protein
MFANARARARGTRAALRVLAARRGHNKDIDMKKLALAAVSTFALTNLALADGKPTWNPGIIKEILKNEKLVKKYGTVGYPLATEIDPGYECKQGLNIYDMSVPLYEQTALGVSFKAGFGGEFRLVNDSSKVGAELVLGPQIEMVGNTFRPLDVTFSAVTKAGPVNVLEATVNGFGYTLTTIPITSSASAITRSEQFGYSLPNTFAGMIGGSGNCTAVCDTYTWSAHAELVAHVGAILSFKISPSGVEAHALASAAAWADAGVTASVHIPNPLDSEDDGTDLTIEPFSARIDAIRLLYGGRAMMLPQPGGTWVAGAASSLSITNMMGADIKFDYELGEYSLLHLDRKSYFKDAEFSCRFKNEMKGSK